MTSRFPQCSRLLLAALGVAVLAVSPHAFAEDLYRSSGFSGMASDRRASQVGDSLTVVINETATASNSHKTSSAKSNNIFGQIGLGALNRSLQLGGNNAFDGTGETSHAGKMLAQLSVVVDEVLPNGDMRVSGYQSLNLNGERTHIKLSGRVRAADITNQNSVLSNNLADATIDYEGRGFVANAAKPGVVTRIFTG